jgi:hypothetical protein
VITRECCSGQGKPENRGRQMIKIKAPGERQCQLAHGEDAGFPIA